MATDAPNDGKGYPLESELVSLFGSLHIAGDVVPTELFLAIRFPVKDDDKDAKTGKPDTVAILILSNLIYWFRPIRPRDSKNDRPLPWRQKFKGEWLARDYEFWVEKFGFTTRQCKEAVARLKAGEWIEYKQQPKPTGGSKNLFKPNYEKLFLTLYPESRVTFERHSEKAERRLNVSRDTFERHSSLLIHEINIKTSSSSNSEKLKTAAAAAADFSMEAHASAYPVGTILAYLQANRENIKNPKGLARKLFRSGEDDDLIRAWLQAETDLAISQAKRRDLLIVPDYFHAFYTALTETEQQDCLERAILLFNADQKLIGGELIDDSQSSFSGEVWSKLWNRIYYLHSTQQAKAA